MIIISPEIKFLLEKSIVAFATVDLSNKPNVVAVAFCKVISDNQILITDNFMNKTRENLENNKNISLSFWDQDNGYQLKGSAEVFTSGEFKEKVDSDPDNDGLAHKAAILVTINEIWDLSNPKLISKV
jgi:hypothetical protein